MSEETPVREARCVYCGTIRAINKPVCPQCGRTWIDTKIGEELPALTPEVVAASQEERQTAPLPPPPEEPPRRPWGILAGVAIGLVIVFVLFSGVFGGNGEDTAAATTTTAPATTTAAPTTTTPTTTTTTTAPTTSTTTSSTTTTTTTTTTLPPIEPVGSAVPIEQLSLGAFGIGPFGFNADTSYLGRLVASLGQPDARSEVSTEMGLCEEDEGVAYIWDGFTTLFRVEDETEVLIGYRLVETGSDHPTQQLTSRSGLELGHTVATLDAIYLQSGLTFEEVDGAQHFVLLRSTDDATLLWGPVSDIDASGIVQGIYSPRPCDGGPVPTP